MSTFLFVNPTSGSHSVQRLQHLLAQLASHNIVPTLLEVRTPAEVATQCATINTIAKPLVIVAGGDGTFNAVVNALTPGTTTLAIVPFGTSNVVAAELGITSVADAISRIVKGETRSLSVGVITVAERTYRFILMAGIGFDGAVVRDVQPRWKRLLKQGGYALSAFKNAIYWDDSLCECTSEKGVLSCHSAIICNSSRYGGDFVLEPGSSPFTAGLTALCITSSKRSSYLGLAVNLFRGAAAESQQLVRHSGSSFVVTGNKAIQIDGDFIGHGPAVITTEANFAKIIV
jgi:diacylglycerol kinase family enzyme